MNRTDKLIETAIDVLHELDWVQGTLQVRDWDNSANYDTDTIPPVIAVCALGALYQAADRLEYKQDVVAEAELRLNQVALEMDDSEWVKTAEMKQLAPVARFNDQPTTTKEDVIQVYKEALNRESE